MAVRKDNLTEFLLDLSTDPDRVERFAANPKAEAARARLTDEERVAVFTGDADQIRTRIEANDNGTGIMTREAPAPARRKGPGNGIMKKKKKRPGKGIMKKKKRPAPKKKRAYRKRGAKK